jgi:hypothetical protein
VAAAEASSAAAFCALCRLICAVLARTCARAAWRWPDRYCCPYAASEARPNWRGLNCTCLSSSGQKTAFSSQLVHCTRSTTHCYASSLLLTLWPLARGNAQSVNISANVCKEQCNLELTGIWLHPTVTLPRVVLPANQQEHHCWHRCRQSVLANGPWQAAAA